MTLRRALSLVSLFVVCLAASATSAPAQTAAGTAASLYLLAPASGYEDGCFDPCMCPVHITDGLAGTWRMTPAPPEPGFDVYRIDQVDWLVPGVDLRVTGSGTYRLATDATKLQRLSLDLTIEGRPEQHFDSGLVVGGGAFPAIDLTVSMNNLVCHDTVFHVSAAPVIPRLTPYGLYGSNYLEGCFGPCDCAVVSKPLLGRFGLMKIRSDVAGTDYAVLDLRWMVRSASTSPANDAYPVTGVGIYRTHPGNGPTAGLPAQRMTLFLNENGAPAVRFDSGLVPFSPQNAGGGPPKKIDLDLAANGFACNDRVYSLKARRGSNATMDFGAIAVDPAPVPVVPVP
ncbi:MAG TPA: hypothetical protein VFC25_17425 [Verrucomicrobiae bacterium]|nr:hypothetical protein [Verrucomicrobiae bacterium]